MQLPYFYIEQFDPAQKIISLDENNSRHAVQVLRMKERDALHLTDGKGRLISASIIAANKRHCQVQVQAIRAQPERQPPSVTIAISLLKNNNRFEWFLEKATEIGVNNIIPLICSRTEKQKIRIDRLQSILVSAMLQSRQTWLPVMPEPVTYKKYISSESFKSIQQKFIAHCVEDEKALLHSDSQESVILIGPEGDFTTDEIDEATKAGCAAVTLGNTRLRTETAGVVAAVKLKMGV